MNIDIQEVFNELQQRFPKELEICVQAVQIRKLQDQLPVEEVNDDN